MTAEIIVGATTVSEAGVYEMDDATYHGDPVPGGSLSFSGSKRLLPPSCPARFKWERDNPQPPTEALDLGKAAHRLVLGVGTEIVHVKADSWRTKAAQQQRDEAHQRDATPLLTDEYEVVHAMADAIKSYPVAMDLFSFGVPEASAFWHDEGTDLWRRARFDWLPQDGDGRLIIPDYKTSHSANPTVFGKTAATFGYHSQAAWYIDAVLSLGLAEVAAFVFVVQEKNPPYLVTTVELDAEALRIGRRLNRAAIEIYRECSETGDWPGYSEDVELVGLPYWYVRQMEQEYAA